MFKNQIRFYGKHAEILKKYSRNTSSETPTTFIVNNNGGEQKDIYLFDTLIQCYMVAAMLGIVNNRKVQEDSSNKEVVANIFVDVLNKNMSNLKRIYQHMVLSEKDNCSVDSRIKKAFTVKMTDEQSDAEQHRLEDYVRGGLEIIDEMFCSCETYEDIANKIYELKDQFNL